MKIILLCIMIITYILFSEANCFASVVRAFIGVSSPRSLHPYESADGITSDHLNQMFETLFWIDYDGHLAPALATEWKRIDPYTIEVKLRRGVKFHNGENFDSNAVKYTFDLFTNPSSNCPNRFYGETISKAEIIDKYTVRITSRVPDSLLVYRLAIVGSIIPPQYHRRVGKRYFSHHPIGTGPYKFQSLIPDKKMVLNANNQYWGGTPNVDRIELVYYKSVDAAMTALLHGNIDYVAHVPGKYSKQIQINRELKPLKILTRQSIMMLVNSKKDGHLKNEEFRKILRSGINFDDVIRYAYNGNGKVAHSLTSPGEPFHDNSLPAISWKPASAATYIRENNIGRHEYNMLITKPFDLAGTMIANQMKAIGIPLKVEYGSDADEEKAVLFMNLRNQIPDVDFLLSYCAHKDALGAFPLLILMHSKGNWSLTDDPTLDKLLDAAINEFDIEQQALLFKKVNNYIYDHALVFPGFHLQDLFGVNKKIEYRPHITGYIYFKDMLYSR